MTAVGLAAGYLWRLVADRAHFGCQSLLSRSKLDCIAELRQLEELFVVCDPDVENVYVSVNNQLVVHEFDAFGKLFDNLSCLPLRRNSVVLSAEVVGQIAACHVLHHDVVAALLKKRFVRPYKPLRALDT